MPITSRRREVSFGPARGIPLDRNAKVRLMTYVDGYNARHRQPGQHHGPITRAYMQVLEALLFSFHNSRSGLCFPSYEAIAKRARCHRDTVRKAINELEAADILTWVRRIWRTGSRVLRTSNAYIFRDPLPCAASWRSKAENPPGTLNQDVSMLKEADPESVDNFDGVGSGILLALHRLGSAIVNRKERGLTRE